MFLIIYFTLYFLLLYSQPVSPNKHSGNVSSRIDLSKVPKSFRVAIITAGSLRSFGYAARSWQRYILRPWKSHVYVFAHVVYDKNCIIDEKGLRLLREFATEIEVSYQITLVPNTYLDCMIPEVFVQKMFAGGKSSVQRGNVIDMLQRRNRAYQLSQMYAKSRNISFDFIVFIRPDSAIYHPAMDFLSWHNHLQNIVNQSSLHSPNRRGAIYVPGSCNFGGICDRFAAGLPADMDTYFKSGWILEVMRWALNSKPNKYQELDEKVAKSHFQNTGHKEVRDIVHNLLYAGSFSERLHLCWFLMNNISQIDYTPGHYPLAFVTLRNHFANFYCESNRSTFLTNEEVDFADRFPGFTYNHASVIGGFDEVASAPERCGALHTLNASAACGITSNCVCTDGRKKGVDF